MLARVKSDLRRREEMDQSYINIGGIAIDSNKLKVITQESEIAISQTENQILKLLAINPGEFLLESKL